MPRALAYDAVSARRLAIVRVEWSPTPRLGCVFALAGRTRGMLAEALIDGVGKLFRTVGLRAAE